MREARSARATDVDGWLPSWRDGAARARIVEFVDAVTSGPDPVPESGRVAVFDNDGTLWTEKPMPAQLHYIVERWAAAVALDPSLGDEEPYRAAVTGDFRWLGDAIDKHYAGDDSDLAAVIAALLRVTEHMSVEDYQASVETFYDRATHPTLGRSYSGTVYQPMVELLRFLEAHGFTCYIVSGGDRDFMRPMSASYYGIPPERVIGSATGLEYDAGSRDVRYGGSFSFLDDGPQKPIRIWSRTGRRPILAAGNTNGDLPMLRFAQKHPRSLSLVVHHDDDTGRGDAPYDKGAEQVLAASREFTVISVRDDWAELFPSG
ncbi:HAD family hydrolase [Jiangella endophytica]|uniref:HAD family hydrolase n=1 Tax=Jiangella endophytica TaxID=1623398 RepID=UPI000E344149|nr:HAD family hydrolase [Jiangella endophytica]